MQLKNSLILLLALCSGVTQGKEQDSYLSSTAPFITYENINDEVLAWATCAATMDILAEVYKSDNPSTSEQLNNLANGAEVAILMSQVSRVLSKDDFEVSELNATITYGKMQMDEAPNVQKQVILSELELEGLELVTTKLTTTLKLCSENNELQKIYVDMMRDLARSGIFGS